MYYEENSANICRAKALSEYEAGILKIGFKAIRLSVPAQICDWLKGILQRLVSVSGL
jgi:hypothetical protein